MPEGVVKKKTSVHELFQDFKLHPSIFPLIEGGETVEYSAHMVAEAGYRGIPKKLYREGFLLTGDAAGFMINTGYSLRGIDLAIMSGIAAAKAIINSKQVAEVGPNYLKELEANRVLPSMRAVDGYYDVMETPWLYDKAPNLMNDLFAGLFTVNGDVPESLRKVFGRLVKKNDLSMWQLIKTGLKGIKTI